MTTRLILIRHGASHHKEDGVVGGPRGCRGLNDLGRSQAERLGQRLVRELKDWPTVIYCSVIPRAIETAEILAATFGDLDVVLDCGLCTYHTPAEADGKPWTEYSHESTVAGGGVFRPFQRGNESWSELVGRTGQTLEQIVARHVGETIVAVAHSETVQSAFIVFGGLPLSPGFEMVVMNTSITEWETKGNPDAWPRPCWVLVRFNDSAHLLTEG